MSDTIPSTGSESPDSPKRPTFHPIEQAEIAKELEIISADRKGFEKSLFFNEVGRLYITCLRNAGISEDEVLTRTKQLAIQTNPPHKAHQLGVVDSCMKWVYDKPIGFRVGGALVAEKLGITMEDADRLGFKHIRPLPKVRQPIPLGPPPLDLVPRTDTIEELAGEIALMCNNSGHRVTAEEVKLFLILMASNKKGAA